MTQDTEAERAALEDMAPEQFFSVPADLSNKICRAIMEGDPMAGLRKMHEASEGSARLLGALTPSAKEQEAGGLVHSDATDMLFVTVALLGVRAGWLLRQVWDREHERWVAGD